MKRIVKTMIAFPLFFGLFVMLVFPLALGKGGSNPNNVNATETVIVKGDFAFVYGRENVPIFRGIQDGHSGVDYNGNYGESVLALSDAVVYKASQTCPPNGGYLGNYCPFDEVAGGGNYVVLKFTYDSKEMYVQYAHLEKVKVKTGQRVKKGDIVGTQGHSGNSTGTHLHLEVHHGGIYAGSTINLIDPEKWFK
ncbi:murein DD-endopeptidase MepM/ murein hydrolase activator NlpD [Breznakia sp. PF5-3]|uniref:M23 family metallopeptidase n=1 Tax=unclassified Breznakia TaxID=2623764 RepID=UPI0024068B2A|nr:MULTISPECIES: M23 family metallopeptidase [unclassified Breznakia]MDF9825178.1 murein DD-endopeptidase MepM/ murein hydrolase activator NlpD [Breznakia sp. PM6-1]MDF9836036.1 murein DD-endopeptidase MepM/ murein hydrolase activator NlpD [Breznakia sp. PF5-3]MDF9838603.1 murein DD-endopeptidase MepM/ murein hydrolase activator NlpD [Breznakia sp. PFB2-8]MDF9860628.1 murein DD-endopeptidase MepM/ murein hydrolase activator NlpD [Breznakia sp. PH5-24]